MYGEAECVIFCDKELAVGKCVIMDIFPIISLHLCFHSKIMYILDIPGTPEHSCLPIFETLHLISFLLSFLFCFFGYAADFPGVVPLRCLSEVQI